MVSPKGLDSAIVSPRVRRISVEKYERYMTEAHHKAVHEDTTDYCRGARKKRASAKQLRQLEEKYNGARYRATIVAESKRS